MPDSATNMIFHRNTELSELREALKRRRSLLLHGPAGVGKSLLVSHLASEDPSILYCPQSSTAHSVVRHLAAELLVRRNSVLVKAVGRDERIKQISAVSLKGVIVEALGAGSYWVALDHLWRPSQSFAGDMKDLSNWGSTPILAVARSAHMEDVGFLLPMFSERGDRYLLGDFDPGTAMTFARTVATGNRLDAANLNDFLNKVVKYSMGNPGAIASMVGMASDPKYRSHGHIKVSPLYVDFRLGSPSTAGKL